MALNVHVKLFLLSKLLGVSISLSVGRFYTEVSLI